MTILPNIKLKYTLHTKHKAYSIKKTQYCQDISNSKQNYNIAKKTLDKFQKKYYILQRLQTLLSYVPNKHSRIDLFFKERHVRYR